MERFVERLPRLVIVAIFSTVTLGASRVVEETRLATVTVNVTHDQFASNEESLGMNPDGSLLAAAWNSWDYNDGCGFSYSTNGGSSWAPRTFVPGFTAYTNDPSVPGTGRFSAAGDP